MGVLAFRGPVSESTGGLCLRAGTTRSEDARRAVVLSHLTALAFSGSFVSRAEPATITSMGEEHDAMTAGAAVPLVGRATELRLIGSLIDGIGDQGGALIVRGEPGIGKSALLAAASRDATRRGMRVLTATGVRSETRLAFAGLHQLLRPVLGHIDRLAVPQREAIRAALGQTPAGAADFFLTALATLDLLAEAAIQAPVLVIAEDAHWLDRSTADVLAFVARRLEYEPILLLGAIRDGFDSPLAESSLPAIDLKALDAGPAGALLDSRISGLSPAARGRILDEALGNPLALLELPVGVGQLGPSARLPAWLPLTTRLERAFAERLWDMPVSTRTVLLVAALNDSPSLSEVLDASTRLLGPDLTIDVLIPAVSARLVELGETDLAFRHPLMRSAIPQRASMSQRHAAHGALADVLIDQPERRVWHRAASAIGPDETVASELVRASERAQQRGASAVAIAGLQRAAQLSEDAADRGQRLLAAAELGFELGHQDLVIRLVAEAEQLELAPRARLHLRWLHGVFDGRQAGGATRLNWMIETAHRLGGEDEDDLALKILWSAAIQCWWSDSGRRISERVVETAEQLRADEQDPRLLAIRAFAAPTSRGSAVMHQLTELTGGLFDDPDTPRVLGSAANAVGAFDAAASLLAASAAGLRAEGRLGLLARALTQQAWSAAYRADLDIGLPVAEEAGRMTSETAQPTIHFTAQAVAAMLAALRGDRDDCDSHSAAAEMFGTISGARALLALATHARGVCALGRRSYSEAYEHLRRLYEPTDPAYHSTIRSFAVADLAEAALHAGHVEQARAHLADSEALGQHTASPMLHAGLRCARPLLATDDEAEALFQAAERSNTTWPFLRARGQLAHGEWLRQNKRDVAARTPLRAARDAFDALGTIPWGDHARQQLRAAGETSRRRTPEARDDLTPQELQIAQLAAQGMTNREIGQMLYLSHRTISSHLYRTFPKLGITSRAELRSALNPSTGQMQSPR